MDACIQRWALLAQEYNVKMRYLEGANNIFADSLSRLPIKQALTETFHDDLLGRTEICQTLGEYIPKLNESIPSKVPWSGQQLINAQQKDPICLGIIRQLRNKQTSEDKKVPPKLLVNFQMVRGALYLLREIKRSNIMDEHLVPYIPDSMMASAFKITHTDSTAGHQGHERTLRLFVRNFYNKNEAKLIYNLCAKCELCIRAKETPQKISLQKYPIPTTPFHTISSDIFGPLRITEAGNQFVVTVRDFTTRYTILVPLKHKSTESIIEALITVFSNFGSSHILLTDNAPEYVSDKMIQFLKHFNTEKKQIAPYHPSSQGLAERINREINKLLRIYIQSYGTDDWDKLLPVLQLTINNTFNASIRETPFFALFGYDSATVTFSPPKVSYSEDESTQHICAE